MPKLDLKKLETAKAQIGEASADVGRWIPVMDAICAASGTTGAMLLQSDVRTLDMPITRSMREAAQGYYENNLHINDVRAIRGAPLLLSGRAAVRDQDLFRSEADMLKDPLYANLSSFGFRWFTGISFRSGPYLWALSLQRTIKEGMFEDNEIQALATLSRPLTEAATLSRLVGGQRLIGSLNAFEHINVPAISLTITGTVLQFNRLAADLFDSEFFVKHSRLCFRDEMAARALDRALYDVVQDNDVLQASQPRTAPIVVRRKTERPILIRIVPVDSEVRSPFLGAKFVLALRDLERTNRPELEIISQAFSLTPTEAKVAAMIANGLSPEEIANQNKVSKETVRSQIKAIFNKTGTRRQSELAILISRTQF